MLSNSSKNVYLLIAMKATSNKTNHPEFTTVNVNPVAKVKGLTVVNIDQQKNSVGSLLVPSEFSIDKHTAIYDLEAKSNSDDLFVIQISTCNGELEVNISEDKKYFEDQSIPLETKRISGTETIIVRQTKRLYVFLTGIQGQKRADCDLKYGSSCNNQHSYVNYIISYYSVNRSLYKEAKLKGKGLVEYSISNESRSKVNLTWKGIEMYNTSSHKFSEELANFFIFLIDDEKKFYMMDSLCYLTELIPIKVINSKELKSEYSTDLEVPIGKKVFINILAKNKETGMGFPFKPVEIYIGSNYSWVYIIVYSVLIVLLVFGLYLIYRKYRAARRALAMELTSDKKATLSEEPDSQNQSREDKDAREMVHQINKEQVDKQMKYADLESN